MEPNTKERLLDTAERLFAAQGFDAVSIRLIVAEAGANLAAVHYHFKSKEALLDAVVLRKATPINQQRLALLDRFEAEAGNKPVPVERTLEAFLKPVFAVAEREPHVARLMGRMHAEGIMARMMATIFQPVVSRFHSALHRALPNLPREELLVRIEFLLGSMVAALLAVAREGHEPPRRDEVAARLVAFLAAGMRAPAQKSPKR
jgi:AcrR family transcriptional regulator